MKKVNAIILTAIAVTVLVVGADAQKKPKYIGMAKARTIASQQVAGRIKSAEREREKGRTIYSFDIKGDDGKNHEVNIDAFTGEIVANDVESAADEAKEKAEDAKPKKKH